MCVAAGAALHAILYCAVVLYSRLPSAGRLRCVFIASENGGGNVTGPVC